MPSAADSRVPDAADPRAAGPVLGPVLGPVRAEVLPGLDALPADARALFGADPALGFQSTRAWYERTAADALPDGTQALFLLCREGGGARDRTLALFPLRRGADGAMSGLTTPYTVLYQPLTAPGLDAAGLRAVGRAFGRACRAWPTLRLDALDADWPGLDLLLAGARDAGLAARRFDHFGNWYEDVAGRGWDEYLAGRPGDLRETVRRKTRACARDPRVSLELVRAPCAPPDALDAAIAAYEEVYARSWKEPEPFPRFGPGLMRAAAAAGVLRVGVLRVDGRPVAAQYWTVCDGAATVLKLAHDEAFKPLSPGTVLTAHLIRALLDEGVRGLDFGRGDDPYKRSWAGRRRQRIGVLLINPRRPAGLAELGRAAAGDLRRWATRRVAGARGD